MKVQDSLLQENFEKFDFIINEFFEKKELDISNYSFEFRKVVENLKENFKNLKFFLEKEEIIYLCVQNLIKNLVKEKKEYLGDPKYMIKKKHYNNILKYLEMEKKNKKNSSFAEIDGNFFEYLDDIVFDYFYMKKKIERQEEESE